MNIQRVKALTGCLVTAQEAQEFLAEGKPAACDVCLQRLLERLEQLVTEEMRGE